MNDPQILKRVLQLLALCILFPACSGKSEKSATDKHTDEAQQATNRIAVPELVRRNLGIEFIEVERRRVAATLRVPGHWELLPAGRREYHAQVVGRVEVLVEPLQQVTPGTPLYRIDSPQWRATQRELQDMELTIDSGLIRQINLHPVLAAHEAHEQSLRRATDVMQGRLQELERTQKDVGGQAAELAQTRVQLAQTQAEIAQAGEAHAEVQATIAELEATIAAARQRYELLLAAAATMTGREVEELRSKDGKAGWRTVQTIEVRAVAEGMIDELPVASGGWVEGAALVATVADVRKVRFRARGLQSDMLWLRDGLPARAVAPHGGSAIRSEPAEKGALRLGVAADPQQRTIDLFLHPEALPTWARPGVAGFLEIETEVSKSEELAVPLAAVQQDGLDKVLFLRDPKDKDKVIRLEADLGLDDGRWVEVLSGLADGDEVVLAGAYELVLASSGSMPKGGHFHADGTFHAEEDK